MSRIPVAVVGLTDGPEACAGASLLHCLPAHRFLRIGIIADAAEAGAHQPRLLDKVAHLPSPSDWSFLPAALELIDALGVVAFLPGSVPIAQQLQRYAVDLAARGSVVVAASGAEQLDQRFATAAAKAALPMVERIALDSPDQAGRQPACLSGMLHNNLGMRKKCTDAWQAQRGAEKLADRHLWISPWNSQHAFEAVVIPDAHGNVLASGSVRILADDDNLRPWMAVSVENPELDALLERACQQLHLDGPAHFLIQYSNSQFKIASLQAGFPMWMEITRAAGPDLVGIALDYALGTAPPTVDRAQRLPAGILFSQSAEDLVLNDEHPLAAQLNSPQF